MNRIKMLRNEKNINQDVLANLLGLEVAGISKLETGRVPLKDEYIIKLANFFNVSTDYILGKSEIRNPEKEISENAKHKLYMMPVYGQISAGQPNWVEECIEGRLPIDPVLFDIVNPEEHFFLRVNGESMNKLVRNGAYALIHKQDVVNDGEIAVVLVNGYEATLKKFTKQGDFVALEPMSNDSNFKTQIYDKTTPIKILGKYVGKFEINK